MERLHGQSVEIRAEVTARAVESLKLPLQDNYLTFLLHAQDGKLEM